VQRVLQRAAVHTAASMPAVDIIEAREEPVLALKNRAQQTLNDLRSGLTLVDPSLPQRSFPLPVRKEMPKVQAARQDAQSAVVKATEEAEKSLTGVAGERYQDLVDRIRAYENAISAGDDTGAEATIAAIVAQLEAPVTSGEASRILGRAKAYQSQIDATVGNDYRRYMSLVPAYRENPRLLVNNLWLEAYQSVLEEPLLEIVSVPFDVGSLQIAAKSSADLMQERRRAEIERRKNEANQAALMGGPYLQWGRDTAGPGEKNRRLNRTGQAGFGRGGGS
jgi:regulator of protease activity HflC (stomatin/prohibitin superfamily)